jgi:hypothetical protein
MLSSMTRNALEDRFRSAAIRAASSTSILDPSGQSASGPPDRPPARNRRTHHPWSSSDKEIRGLLTQGRPAYTDPAPMTCAGNDHAPPGRWTKFVTRNRASRPATLAQGNGQCRLSLARDGQQTGNTQRSTTKDCRGTYPKKRQTIVFPGARSGTRTRIALRLGDFKSPASTGFAIRARCCHDTRAPSPAQARGILEASCGVRTRRCSGLWCWAG